MRYLLFPSLVAVSIIRSVILLGSSGASTTLQKTDGESSDTQIFPTIPLDYINDNHVRRNQATQRPVTVTDCRLQIECNSPIRPTTLKQPTLQTAEGRVRVPIRSAQGPAGPIGPQGIRGVQGPMGPRGPPGPPGECVENANNSDRTLDQLSEQMNILRTHVAFFAGLEYNIVDKPVERVPRVIMNKVITNVGQAYDPIAGEFTAPVDGVYVLAVTISAQGKTKAAVRLMQNDQQIFDLWSESSPWSTTSNQAVLRMNAGDKAWLGIREGAYFLHGYMYSTFSGYLLFRL